MDHRRRHDHGDRRAAPVHDPRFRRLEGGTVVPGPTQGRRRPNSIWYWGLRHFTGGQNSTYNSLVGVLSPLLILAVRPLDPPGPPLLRAGGNVPVDRCRGVDAGRFHALPQGPFTPVHTVDTAVLRAAADPGGRSSSYLADFVLDVTISVCSASTSGSGHEVVVIGVVNFGVWVHAVVLTYPDLHVREIPTPENHSARCSPRHPQSANPLDLDWSRNRCPGSHRDPGGRQVGVGALLDP